MRVEAWHGVELRHLAALEAIAAEGSFSAAGARMGYSQSAISGQIAKLEKIVGARLIARLRGSRRVELTPEGAVLLEHAKVITARLGAARADLSSMLEDGSPTLRIGTFQSVSQTLLPPILRRLQVQTTMREDPATENLVELLLQNELDLAFVVLPVPNDEIESLELVRDPWTVVARDDHPLARLKRPLGAADLSRLPLLTYERSRAQSFIEGSLSAGGADLNVVSRLADTRSILSFAEAGLGVALVPRLAIDTDFTGSRLRMLALEGQPRRLIGLAWNRGRKLGAAAQRFVELATAAELSVAA
ncbi:MAG TPA: LysR family transcriptional regulator [Gaiellaceae bacterium]